MNNFIVKTVETARRGYFNYAFPEIGQEGQLLTIATYGLAIGTRKEKKR